MLFILISSATQSIANTYLDLLVIPATHVYNYLIHFGNARVCSVPEWLDLQNNSRLPLWINYIIIMKGPSTQNKCKKKTKIPKGFLPEPIVDKCLVCGNGGRNLNGHKKKIHGQIVDSIKHIIIVFIIQIYYNLHQFQHSFNS